MYPDIKGLNIDADDGNFIEIEESCKFLASRIIIKGKNNKIKLSKALLYKNFIVNFSGNNKTVIIEDTAKNIVGLKIVSIRGENQTVEIGHGFSCGGMEIQMNDGNEQLSIGDDCLFSWGIKMRTSDGHSVIDIESGKAINLPKNISIGNHVWIGEDVKLLKGVVIPNNSVIGSYAVVTKAFENENTVIAGFPAKVVKESVQWDRRMPYEYNSIF
jgi:acetyltransferase-like isoleucine patch superfamily enzyme